MEIPTIFGKRNLLKIFLKFYKCWYEIYFFGSYTTFIAHIINNYFAYCAIKKNTYII